MSVSVGLWRGGCVTVSGAVEGRLCHCQWGCEGEVVSVSVGLWRGGCVTVSGAVEGRLCHCQRGCGGEVVSHITVGETMFENSELLGWGKSGVA